MPPVRATRGRGRTLGAAAALALAACVVSSCGDDSNAGLSQQRAATLLSALDEVQARVAGSDCAGAAQQASAFHQRVASLPARVDRDLRDALDRSAARLESLVARQCKPETPSPVEQPPATGENGADQQGKGKQDKKPKKPKKDEQQPPDTGGSGQDGSTGVTGQQGTTLPPEGG